MPLMESAVDLYIKDADENDDDDIDDDGCAVSSVQHSRLYILSDDFSVNSINTQHPGAVQRLPTLWWD